MHNRGADPEWKERWEAGFRAGYIAQELDLAFDLGDESHWLWDVVYKFHEQYCLPEFKHEDVLNGLQLTMTCLRQHEQERMTLQTELETYRQLALTLQKRLDGSK